MKKLSVLILVCALSLGLVSSALALIPVGARNAGMGGCGAAISNDLTSAYYNPAGLMRSKMVEGRLGLATNPTGMTEIQEIFSSMSSPADFMSDKFDDEIDALGTLSGIVGVSFSKIGLSIIPQFLLSANKEADSASGLAMGNGGVTAAITAGTSFNVPGLPFATLDVGANIKSINYMGASVLAAPVALTYEGTSMTSVGNGVGLDVGILMDIDIPMVTKLTVGAVIRDMFETINYTNKTSSVVYDADGNITEDYDLGDDEESSVMPTTTVIGVAGTVPGFGTLLTSDMVVKAGQDHNGDPNVNDFRFGIEQPLMMGMLNLRAGWATGPEAATTIGFGFGAGVNVDFAYVIDGKEAKANSAVLEVSGAF